MTHACKRQCPPFLIHRLPNLLVVYTSSVRVLLLTPAYRSKQPPSPPSPELAPAPPGDPAKMAALEKGRQLLQPSAEQREQVRSAVLQPPQVISIEVKPRHKPKASVEAFTNQAPSPEVSRPSDAVATGSAAAERLDTAASADPVVASQPLRGERQALRGAAAGQPAAEHASPQPTRCVTIHHAVLCREHAHVSTAMLKYL